MNPQPLTNGAAGSSSPAGPPVRISRQSVKVLIVVTVVLVVLALLSAGLNGGLNRWPWEHQHVARRVAVPLAGRRTAVVQIDSGADRISVTTADLGADLAVVTTPEGAAIHPVTTMDGDRLHVRAVDDGTSAQDGTQGGTGSSDSRNFNGGVPAELDVRIATGVLWDVVVTQGSKQVSLSLGSGRVHSIELEGGSDQADLVLPEPVGESLVKITGGLNNAAMHLPDGAGVALTFSSGAGSAVIDGQTHEGIASGTTITGSQPVTGAVDRWVVDLVAGVATVTLDRHAQ